MKDQVKAQTAQLEREKAAKDKKELLDYVDNYLSSEQNSFILKLVKAFSQGNFSKGKLMELTGTNTGKIDSALPINYVRAIQELYPGFDTFNYGFDYREGHGKLVNFNEELVDHLIKLFK